ncbi:unnamed protein product [Phytomonas sp. Hart1]|nr:unnamed protein product [Phytomonas sp. Hart1]|eukprot:CCW72076.1 unnamed protein product [Phytomonas sp. isolate Hart1]
MATTHRRHFRNISKWKRHPLVLGISWKRRKIIPFYLISKYKGIKFSGKLADAEFLLQNDFSKGLWPKFLICDPPRKWISDGWLGYGYLEELNQKIIVCTKYESLIIYKPYAHIIVFADAPPNVLHLSKDRWKVINIDEFEREIDIIECQMKKDDDT